VSLYVCLVFVSFVFVIFVIGISLLFSLFWFLSLLFCCCFFLGFFVVLFISLCCEVIRAFVRFV
jgi:hypothetical protein